MLLHTLRSVLPFVPIGILIPFIWRFYRKMWRLVLIALIFSMMFELLQLLTARGNFELKEIILNTSGAIIGYVIFAVLYDTLQTVRQQILTTSLVPYKAASPVMNSKLLAIVQMIFIVCFVTFIFCFSSDNATQSSQLSTGVTEKILALINRILMQDFSVEQITQKVAAYEGLIRKCAHMTEYALLAFSISVFLFCRRLRAWRTFLVTELLVLLTASLDEYYQTGIEGRHGSPVDVLIDICGATILLLFLGLCIKLYRRMICSAQNNKKKGSNIQRLSV